MGDFVNLNDVGTLTRSAQGYEGVADDKASESRSFTGKMDASQRGLIGSAGSTFTNVAGTHSGNLTQLANRIAEQAVRASRGEKTLVSADDDANTAQSGTQSTVEGNVSAVSRPINV
ncbi:hypothetical protein Acy02nite_31460 [Actinoplanes cyaneus]|uniref:Uncharacterized protein n=1 Tax=Actinoplanes cyaneus TaxID=52696 RepID=A0A919IFV8_9ACTN|nr:hypothetical protein [Actinoplanes cyaneus]MCW2142457.1 hypothetical protein [Actinoplanes cyaneus]GID65265.1 hypothetical protein Acy02nite_31460 [Actinoplanes cyaneus]